MRSETMALRHGLIDLDLRIAGVSVIHGGYGDIGEIVVHLDDQSGLQITRRWSEPARRYLYPFSATHFP